MKESNFGKHYYGLLGHSSSFTSAFSIAQVCITVFVFNLTQSAVAVGIVAIVETLAVLLVSLPVGTLVDKFNKGSLLSISGAMGFFVMLGFVLISTSFQFNLFLVLGLAAVWGASREIMRTAGLSTLPDLVNPKSLSGANGIFRALNSSLGSISNALAGGIIVVFGIAIGFGFGAAGYLASSLLALIFIMPFLKRKQITSSGEETEKHSMLENLTEGFKWLVARKGFFLMTISATFFNFFMDMTYIFFVVYVEVGLDANPLVYGFMLAALAVGDVVGSLIPGRIDLLKFTGKINVVFFGGVIGVSILLMGLFPTVPIAIAFSFTWGISIGLGVNLWLTSAHNIVPPEMRGRYFALDGVLSSISPVAIAVGALVISYVGILDDFVISGILMLVFTLVFALMKSLWQLDGRLKTAEISSD